MSKEEFADLPENDQQTIKNAVKYARILMEAEVKSGKSLKKFKPKKNPFWVAQAEAEETIDILTRQKQSEFAAVTSSSDDGEDEWE